MNAYILLMICIAAQILIVGGLGIYLLRRFLRRRKETTTEESSSEISPESKE